jgi:hypothetical protein
VWYSQVGRLTPNGAVTTLAAGVNPAAIIAGLDGDFHPPMLAP